MTARRKAARKTGRRTGRKTARKTGRKAARKAGTKAARNPGSILRLTAARVATTTIRVSDDGTVEIVDAALCELEKRFKAQGRTLKLKVVCPEKGLPGGVKPTGRPSGTGQSGGGDDGEGPGNDTNPPESNCE